MKIHEPSLLATSSFWTPRSKAQWLHGSSRLTKTWLLAGVHFSRGYCSPSLHPEAATEQRGFSTMFTFIARSLFSTLEIQHLSSPAAARRKLRKAPWNFRMHVASRVTFVNVAKWTRTSCMAEIQPVEGRGICHSFLGPKHSLQSAFHRINSINHMNDKCDVNCLQPPLPESGAQKGIEMGSMPMTSIRLW